MSTPAISVLKEAAVEPLPSEATLSRARALVREFSWCFVAWKQEPTIQSLVDVRDVIYGLRAHGGHKAWNEAQALAQSLQCP
jgi:hypothetical protein